jgi:hypothetical protein
MSRLLPLFSRAGDAVPSLELAIAPIAGAASGDVSEDDFGEFFFSSERLNPRVVGVGSVAERL